MHYTHIVLKIIICRINGVKHGKYFERRSSALFPFHFTSELSQIIFCVPGADLGFSRGGGGGSTFLFGLVPVLVQNFCAAGKILKNNPKKGIFRHFLENFDQKIAFFRRALPPQN